MEIKLVSQYKFLQHTEGSHYVALDITDDQQGQEIYDDAYILIKRGAFSVRIPILVTLSCEIESIKFSKKSMSFLYNIGSG